MKNLTEQQLIKVLCSKDYIKHIYIKSPYLNMEPKPLKGYYLNPDKRVYFYADDRIGLGLSLHYNTLMVKDYLGRFRPFITKRYLDSSLRNATYDCNFDLVENLPRGGFSYMNVLYSDIQPGDLYAEDLDGDPYAVNTLVHYHPVENVDNPFYEIFYLIQTPGQHLIPFGEVQRATYQHPLELEESIYTLVPIDIEAYETVH